MNPIPFAIAIVLSVLGLCGQRWFFVAIAAGVVIGFPVYQAGGLRSAIYVPEIVLMLGFLGWVVRRKSQDIDSVFPSMGWHLVVIMVYMFLATVVGYLWLGRLSDAVIRPFLAVLRFGAISLSFLVPASIPMSERQFSSAIRLVYFCLLGFLVIGFLEYYGFLSIAAYRSDVGSEGKSLSWGLGGFNRASTGTIAQYGVFVSLLVMRLKRIPVWLGVASLAGFLWLILASFSRTSLLSLLVFAASLIMLHKGNRMRNLAVFFLGLIVVSTCIAYSPAISARFSTLLDVGSASEDVSSGRLAGWGRIVDWMLSNPLIAVIGVGADNFANYLQFVVGLLAGHNVYLHTAVELGILGGIIYMAFFFRITRLFYKAMKLPGDTGRVGGLAFCLMIALFFANLTADLWYPAMTMISCMHMTMLLLGILAGRLRHPEVWGEYGEAHEFDYVDPAQEMCVVREFSR